MFPPLCPARAAAAAQKHGAAAAASQSKIILTSMMMFRALSAPAALARRFSTDAKKCAAMACLRPRQQAPCNARAQERRLHWTRKHVRRLSGARGAAQRLTRVCRGGPMAANLAKGGFTVRGFDFR